MAVVVVVLGAPALVLLVVLAAVARVAPLMNAVRQVQPTPAVVAAAVASIGRAVVREDRV